MVFLFISVFSLVFYVGRRFFTEILFLRRGCLFLMRCFRFGEDRFGFREGFGFLSLIMLLVGLFVV